MKKARTIIVVLLIVSFVAAIAIWSHNYPSALVAAIRRGDREAITRLKGNHRALNQPTRILFSEQSNGWTPLIWASVLRDEQSVAMLLEAGADPAIADEGGRNALHHAAMWHCHQCIKHLIEHGIDVDLLTRSGDSALHYAVGVRDPTSVRLLLEHGAEANARNSNGLTPLGVAIYDSQSQTIVDELVSHGADPALVKPERR